VKEDVLEQVVEDYLQLRGYFARHNLRFKPDRTAPGYVLNQDSVPSDIDVVGLNPHAHGPERVWVVSCKSWQPGLDPGAKLKELRGEKANPKRETWRGFRELWNPKWAAAFRTEIATATGASTFRYSLAVTRLRGSMTQREAEDAWSSDPTIARNLAGSRFSFLTMREMWSHLQAELSTTPAPSEIGRLAQLLKAAEIEA
jgi:hypothetical protein